MTDRDVLEVSIHIDAEPETVFPYFTDPVRYVQWMGTTAILQPVSGGTYRVSMRDGVEAAGEFVEVDPPRRLVFTCVVLRHHDLPDAQQRSDHAGGWEMYLTRLGRRLAGGDPGPDPNA